MVEVLGAVFGGLALVLGAFAAVQAQRNSRAQNELGQKSATREDLNLIITSQANYIERQDRRLTAQDERATVQDKRILDLEGALKTMDIKHEECERRLREAETIIIEAGLRGPHD